jgi:hypothetical protein
MLYQLSYAPKDRRRDPPVFTSAQSRAFGPVPCSAESKQDGAYDA